ncbi:MAG TPA: LysM peptidoglycan-binding domain-containing protein [Actinomycetota bacterium]|nr:LysM peptidoglycan-binding domain-containing protein [Actinomycetota bacterium]
MAVRSEDLAFPGPDAVVYRFPATAARRSARRRMYARRRMTVATLAVVVVATLAGGGVAETAPEAPARRAVTVRPGDTLWGIAEAHAPAGVDVRAYVDTLIELNGLEGPLQAGTRLRLVRGRG